MIDMKNLSYLRWITTLLGIFVATFPVGAVENGNPNLANLPVPVLGDHPGWVTMYNFAWANEKRLILYNSKYYSRWWVDEGFGASNSIFQWDTLYGTMGNKWGYYEFPTIETQNNFYYFQLSNGFIGQKLSEKNGSQPPRCPLRHNKAHRQRRQNKLPRQNKFPGQNQRSN